LLSPCQLYNGPTAKQRGRNHLCKVSSPTSPETRPSTVRAASKCLPNMLFFRQEKREQAPVPSEDTLSLKSREVRREGVEGKKDLLDHFQKFLHQMEHSGRHTDLPEGHSNFM